jgi:Flp pilus assembly pilin Flp
MEDDELDGRRLSLTRLARDTQGITSVEHILLACLIAVVAFLAWQRLGDTVRSRVAGVDATIAQLPVTSAVASAPSVARRSPAGPPGATSAALGAAASSARTPGVVSEFFAGAIQGDYGEGSSIARTVGQIGVGLIPIVGQAADLRDLTAAVGSLRRREPGAGLGVVAASIGFIPGVGDAAKAAIRGASAARSGSRVAEGAGHAAPSRARAPESGAQTASAAAPIADTALPGGTFSTVRREGDDVVKEIRETVEYGREPWHLSPAERAMVADTQAHYSNVLRDVPELAAIVPETRVTAPGVMRQRFVGGLDYHQLYARDRALAERAVQNSKRITEVARRRLQDEMARRGPHAELDVEIDTGYWNFRFDEQGRVTGWFDPVVIHREPRIGLVPVPTSVLLGVEGDEEQEEEEDR